MVRKVKYNLRLGEVIQTIGGNPAIVFRTEGEPPYPWLGIVKCGEYWKLCAWTDSGASGTIHLYDLQLEKTVDVTLTIPKWATHVADREVGIRFYMEHSPGAISLSKWLKQLGDKK